MISFSLLFTKLSNKNFDLRELCKNLMNQDTTKIYIFKYHKDYLEANSSFNRKNSKRRTSFEFMTRNTNIKLSIIHANWR